MNAPSKSLCDLCKNAYAIPGGWASMGGVSYPQRYCAALKIAIHFGGKTECASYDATVNFITEVLE